LPTSSKSGKRKGWEKTSSRNVEGGVRGDVEKGQDRKRKTVQKKCVEEKCIRTQVRIVSGKTP